MHHVQLAHEHVVCHGCRGARNLILTSGHRQDRETFTAGVGLSARLAACRSGHFGWARPGLAMDQKWIGLPFAENIIC